MAQPLGKTVWPNSKNSHRTIIRPSKSTAGNTPSGIKSRDLNRPVHTHAPTVHISVTHCSLKAMTTTCSTKDKGRKSMESTHTKEPRSASDRKSILTHAVTWVNLGDITLSEVSPSQKDNYDVVLPMDIPTVFDSTELEAGERRKAGVEFNGYRIV